MSENWEAERESRRALQASICPTGNPWLDEGWAGGINREQLILVAAKTGTGKTHFGVQLGLSAAKKGKKVFYFALEAARHEIERRRLYTQIHRAVRSNLADFKMPRFREWIHQQETAEWTGVEKYVSQQIEDSASAFTVRYRTYGYGPEDFERDAMDLLHEKPDLIIVDHLHHFLLQGSENDALKSAIRTIDRLRSDLETPIVVLAQLRKNDSRKQETLLSRIEDIRGTAALTDLATDVVTISRIPTESIQRLPPNLYNPFYFNVGKSRTAPELQNFVAAIGFDLKTGEYQTWYVLNRYHDFKDPSEITSSEIPDYAKNAKGIATQTPFSAPKKRREWNEG